MQVKTGKQYEFSAAHQLLGHKGKCAYLHGHNYKVEVWIKGEPKDLEGASDNTMVMDFQDLDDIVRPILEDMDHSFLVDEYVHVPPSGEKIYVVHARTTAENLAIHIHSRIKQDIVPGFLLGVIVWETPKAYAEYIATA